jgi:ATP-binding cassette subfamily B protein
MRPLLKLNPYFAKYRWHILLGALFIGLSNLFAVYAPQVVREAIDLIADGIAQMKLPVDQYRTCCRCGWAGQAWTSKAA